MKIFSKLLLVLVLMTSLLFISLYMLVQWGFDRGMLNYVNQREVQSLELLSDNLVALHQHTGNWQVLTENHRRWHDLLRQSMQGNRLNENQIEALITSDFRRNRMGHKPPKPYFPREFPRSAMKPPERALDFNNSSPKKFIRADEKEFIPKRSPSLLDANKQVILGNFNDGYNLKVINNGNDIIGYIALAPRKKLTSTFDLAFVKHQRGTRLIILFITLSITLLVAIVLSRYFVRRIQTIVKATEQLNAGQYDIALTPKGNDEFSGLAKNVNNLAMTLASNENSRKQWLADTSHELRTPLAIIKGEIEALQDGIRQITPQSLQSLADEVDHLQKLIDDLNQLSNADIGALSYNKEALNMSELLLQNLVRSRQTLHKANIEVRHQIFAEDVILWADATRINQLIDNLLTNAIKYTDAPGFIDIRLNRIEKQLVLVFEDSSPSVPLSSLDKLFDHLYRVENSRNRKTGGFGLGLTLCKKIVLAHQGSISAYASPQGGLGIKVILPVDS
jgi:two-component system sensor histidine kinase BaeS